MKTKFNKASNKDKTLVTVNLAQFDKYDDLYIVRESLKLDDQICLRIDGQDVLFKVNRVRDGRAVTATTHCFPRYLRLPQVGRPTFAQVTEVC